MDYIYSTDRVSAFESMLGQYPEYEFVHREHGWRYVTENPWGNWVHGFCEFDGDVHKFGCSLAREDSLGRDGLYADWWLGTPPFLRLWAITDDETIDRHAFEYWMVQYRDLIVTDVEAFGPELGFDLVRVGVARRKRG